MAGHENDKILQLFKPQDLDYIINSDSIKDIYRKYGKNNIKRILGSNIISPIPNKKSLSFAEVLTHDAPSSFTLLTLAIALGLTSFATLPLTIISGLFLSISFVMGGIYGISSYKKLEKQEKQATEFNELIQLKNNYMDALIKKQGGDPALACAKYSPLKPAPKHKINWSLASSTSSMIAFTSGIAFEAYFLTANIVFTAFGLTALSAAMLTPIGIGITLAITCAIGIYFGYQHYQSQKSINDHNKQKKLALENLKDKEMYYHDLVTAQTKSASKQIHAQSKANTNVQSKAQMVPHLKRAKSCNDLSQTGLSIFKNSSAALLNVKAGDKLSKTPLAFRKN
jgi:hypothetical protein